MTVLYSKLMSSNVLVAYTPHSNLFGLPIAWFAGVPVRIGTHHGHIEGSTQGLARLHGWLTNSWLCTKMVAVSDQVRSYAIRKEAANPDKLAVIENGVEQTAVTLSETERSNLRVELGIQPGQMMMLTVGRLTEQKGHIYLIDAAAKLLPNNPGLKFVFAGEGPKDSPLKTKVEELGVGKAVIFLGVRHDIPRLLAAADIFIQPSLWEGLSLALLEALFAKLPVLATKVEGAVSVVEDGVSALLVTPGDADALAFSLQRLIHEPELRRKLAEAGYGRATRNYGIDAMCRAYEQLVLGYLNA
jgi:glycosyltransferase involved in cell wall biosynthesis